MVIFCLCSLIACDNSEETPSTDTLRLETPQNLTLNKSLLLSWDKVENADGYCVSINGVEYEVYKTNLDLSSWLSIDDCVISVYAFSEEDEMTSEAATITYSASSSATLSAPKYFELSTLKALSWSAISRSESFNITVNGKAYTTQSEEIDLSGILSETEINTISVYALGSESGIFSPRTTVLYDPTHPEFLFTEINDGTEYKICAANSTACKGVITIPEKENNKPVTEIEALGFSDCENITGVTIPSSVKTIGSFAFQNCSLLADVTIGEGVTEIGSGAFYGCDFEQIVLPESLEILDTNVFANCDSLKKLNIPENVSSISAVIGTPIGYCKNLTELTVDKNNKTYYSEGNCIIAKSTSTLIHGCDTSVIPDDIKIIGQSAFSGCAMEEITIPYGVEEIGKSAFNYCLNLKHVYLPDGLKTIGSDAFDQCYNLQDVVIPESVTTVGDDAFYRGSIYLPFDKYPSGWSSK